MLPKHDPVSLVQALDFNVSIAAAQVLAEKLFYHAEWTRKSLLALLITLQGRPLAPFVCGVEEIYPFSSAPGKYRQCCVSTRNRVIKNDIVIDSKASSLTKVAVLARNKHKGIPNLWQKRRSTGS